MLNNEPCLPSSQDLDVADAFCGAAAISSKYSPGPRLDNAFIERSNFQLSVVASSKNMNYPSRYNIIIILYKNI